MTPGQPGAPDPGAGGVPIPLPLALEQCAYTAWPAEVTAELDGWRLRTMRGVTRRANSAWTGATGTRLPLAARIQQVEAFYATHAQPSIIQLSAATAPPGLDDVLAGRGYQIEAPVSVQTAGARQVAQAAGPTRGADGARVQARVEDRAFEAWFEISCRRGRFAAVEEVYRGLIERIAVPALFAVAEIEGQLAAAGMAVVDGAWAGIFSMLTLGPQRRQGAARALLGALARQALARGARGLYLQVERENQGAVALYAGLGFTECFGYHYRVR